MPEQRSHGFPYIEPPRHDELPDGVRPEPTGDGKRDAAGRFVGGEGGSAAIIGAKGGSKQKSTTKLSHKIATGTLSATSLKRARTLRKALSSELASTVGAGLCGVAASLMLKWAAQKTAAAEEAFEKGDYETHRKLSESARMDILYAREHAAKEAQTRPKADDLSALQTKLGLPPAAKG